ncbi:MAG: hypothetical protein JXA74_06255 [Anaerolineae bacterium]|nr:hypothetical protein [Anaerolineae bacterium]
MTSRFVLRTILLCALLLSASVMASAADPWSAPYNVSASAADTEGGALARDSQGRVHAVWDENGQLFHRVRTGEAWSARVSLFSGEDPALGADGQGRVHLAYVGHAGGIDRIHYAVWSSGSGWSSSLRPTDGGGDADELGIAVTGAGRIAIVWRESAESPGPIYLAESDDGELWSVGPIPNARGDEPTAVIDSLERLYVAWEDELAEGLPLEIWLSVQQLDEWSLPEAISYTGEGEDSEDPALALGPDGVYLAWETEVEGAQVIKVAVGAGSTWGDAAVRSTGAEAGSPVLAFGPAGRGHLVWEASGALWHRRRDPSGVWSDAQSIVGGQANLALQGLTAGVGPHVIWLAGAGSRELYHSAQIVTPEGIVYLPLVLR